MKQLASAVSALLAGAACMTIGGLAFGQVRGDTSPTADIDEPPRSLEQLELARPGSQDSVMAGGSGWGSEPPETTVPLPTLCEIDPQHPECDEGGGGRLPVDPPIVDYGSCSFGVSPEVGFQQMMRRGNGSCAQHGMYTSDTTGWVSVTPRFALANIRNLASVSWSGCASSSGKICYGETRSAHMSSTLLDPSWQVTATVTTDDGERRTYNFTAYFSACGVVGMLECL